MFSSLGCEKEMIAIGLAHNVQELIYMEELVNDLRTDNNKLPEKVKEWCKVGDSGGAMELEELKEKIMELSKKLLKTLQEIQPLLAASTGGCLTAGNAVGGDCRLTTGTFPGGLTMVSALAVGRPESRR
ncbi:hypothetical protein KFK09_019589 [Dendrobium nobile]|uniref:Uncharacterized protein n=1 Tax=Dendrobium nobile TaxID=94219 RepID=A0A8T3AQR3_DENNO|nr:hypothetical protein KFK09_019589 [Dendrobium nobile]